MNKIISLIFLALPSILFAQNSQDSINVFKKRVLERTEIDLLTSYYTQDGQNASVTGGIGTEQLNDYATDINIAIPLNEDDVFTIDATISAYTSASSSNLNPFTGASSDDDDDDDDGRRPPSGNQEPPTGTPWVAASGASRGDTWISGNFGYSHSSDDRNKIYSASISLATEYDYKSLGASIGFTRLFNQKNTEISIGASAYLDNWDPEYPTEIETFVDENGDLNADFFEGVDILNQSGNAINKRAADAWSPINSTLIEDTGRNTFSLSLAFSQILGNKTQVSIFSDITYQTGWLANPMQRVYFGDVPNFYIGNAASIPIYTDPSNTDVFQLADDIERLPDSRFKVPVGIRLNQYINEFIVVNTYYRYYNDDWGLTSHTFNIEVPIKIGNFTLYPNYRYYNQSAADYFAPYEQHQSTSEFYTSDFDLSKFNANQFGFGIKYTDIFTKKYIGRLGLKNISLNYNYYKRNTGLEAHIVSLGAKFVLGKKRSKKK